MIYFTCHRWRQRPNLPYAFTHTASPSFLSLLRSLAVSHLVWHQKIWTGLSRLIRGRLSPAALRPRQPIDTAELSVKCVPTLAQATGRRRVWRRGRVHCLAATGLMDGAVRDAGGCQARPGSCSSTMSLSVTCRLPLAVLPQRSQEHPPPYAADTSFCCWTTNRWKFSSRQAGLRSQCSLAD